MDEQPRLDKRRRSESEDHQSLAATPSVPKVYRTNSDGVKSLMSMTTISFYDAKCREQNLPDSRCPGLCCSNCTNTSCPFPRGALVHKRGVYVVKFKNVGGQIICQPCADVLSRHGTCRSEAAMSTLIATKALKSSAHMTQLTSRQRSAHATHENSRLKHQVLLSALADPDFGPTKSGESVSCDLSVLLKSVCVTS